MHQQTTYFKSFVLLLFISIASYAQEKEANNQQKQEIHSLIDRYAQARETKDRKLLEYILTSDIDQLVSSGTWRNNKDESMQGMLKSSKSNPGTRILTIEKIRFLNATCGLVDARYEIHNTNGSIRKMWSSFVVVYQEDQWKISAIRNMLPAPPNKS